MAFCKLETALIFFSNFSTSLEFSFNFSKACFKGTFFPNSIAFSNATLFNALLSASTMDLAESSAETFDLAFTAALDSSILKILASSVSSLALFPKATNSSCTLSLFILLALIFSNALLSASTMDEAAAGASDLALMASLTFSTESSFLALSCFIIPFTLDRVSDTVSAIEAEASCIFLIDFVFFSFLRSNSSSLCFSSSPLTTLRRDFFSGVPNKVFNLG